MLVGSEPWWIRLGPGAGGVPGGAAAVAARRLAAARAGGGGLVPGCGRMFWVGGSERKGTLGVSRRLFCGRSRRVDPVARRARARRRAPARPGPAAPRVIFSIGWRRGEVAAGVLFPG
jgi:hypothetical protein